MPRPIDDILADAEQIERVQAEKKKLRKLKAFFNRCAEQANAPDCRHGGCHLWQGFGAAGVWRRSALAC
jgi:hypothetical protein